MVLLTVLMGLGVSRSEARSFYVDCSKQGASGGTGAIASPLTGLEAINRLTFKPGDRILFREGTMCEGTLEPQGSGDEHRPIVMGRYGAGAKPVLDAKGASGAVVMLHNVEFWEISGIELRNDADAPDYRSGVMAVNDSGKTLRHLWLRGLTISHVKGWPGGWYSRNAGIGIQTNHTSPESKWEGIRIEDNEIHFVDRIGIAVTPDHDGEGTGRTRGLVIRGNRIDHSGGDDILVVKGTGALIAGNKTENGGALSATVCPPKGEYCNRASASIWVAGSDHTVIRGNGVRCYINQLDGQAFDVDWGNVNTLVEGNYSTQNRGGFLLLMPAIHVRSEPSSGVPSSGTVIRNNVSDRDTMTDACEVRPPAKGPASVIHLTGDFPSSGDDSASGPLIENNTIYLPKGATADVIGSRAGASVKGGFVFAKNIVWNEGGGGYVTAEHAEYAENLSFGPNRVPGASTREGKPEFVGPLDSTDANPGLEAFRLKKGSPGEGLGQQATNAKQ